MTPPDELPPQAPARARNRPATSDRSPAVFPRARSMGRLGGVDVRVDPSLLLVGLLVVWTFQSRFADGRGLAASITMAAVTALLFFGSVLGHELAHAWEGRHRGVDVRGITLFALGGVTEMELDTRRARDEFAISAVGPWSSLVIAAGFGLVAETAGRLGFEAVGDVAGLLGWTNLALAVFNLVPGAPLDGGRVLRSLAWGVLGDRHRATTIASRAGQLVGLGIAVFGIAQLLDGGWLDGLWLVVLGGYILRGATGELAAGRVEAALDGRTAGEVAPHATTVPPGTAVDRAAALAAELRDDDLVVVVDPDLGPIATATVGELRATDPTDASLRSVEEVGEAIGELAELPADVDVRTLARAADTEGLLAVVHDDGRRTLTTRRGVDGALRTLLRLDR